MKAAKAFRGLTCILSLLLAISIGLTSGMFSAEGHINRFLGIETTVLVPKAEGVGQASSARYPSSFSADIAHYTAEEEDAKSKAADEFIEWEIEESAVLLRNNNHALPLTKEEMGRVSLFGRATVDPYFKSQSGGGEGGAGEHVDYLAALGERGFTVNETLLNAYRADQSPKTTYEHLGESPASVYTDDVLASFKDTEVAIVMFSRMAGESHDLLPEYKDSDGAIIGMLELSANERDMMTLVKKYKDSGCFKKIIVLLNTSNAMEVDWLDTYGVDACMWIGGPGSGCGFRGVADLLTGASDPSGRLTDTYATSAMSAPAMMNFGDISYTNGGTPHYLALSKNERDMIAWAKAHCQSVVLVVNSSNPVELMPVMQGELEVNAIVWAGHPGDVGFDPLADILCGEVNPSGRLVDLFATNFLKTPSFANWGNFHYTNSETGTSYSTNAIASIGLPQSLHCEGANGVRLDNGDGIGSDHSRDTSSWCMAPEMAATWNTELMREMGEAMGQEALLGGRQGRMAPAMNLHRSPFQGRVFEYYSEDPVLSGKVAAAVVTGTSSSGMFDFIKHFGLNDQETNRASFLHTWATEQVVRELYNKPFEICIREARKTIRYTADENGTVATKVMRGCSAMMGAQNCFGPVVAFANADLMTSLVRDEWNFHGYIITDMYNGSNEFVEMSIRAGTDGWLVWNTLNNMNDFDSPTAKAVIRNALHHVAFTIANSAVLQHTAPGSVVYYDEAPWRIAVRWTTIGITVLAAFMIVWTLLRAADSKKHPDQYNVSKRKAAKVK